MESTSPAPTFRARLRRRPWVLALLGYIVVAACVLAPTIRPGRTVVPLDILTAVPPYTTAEGYHPHNPLPSDAAFQFYPWYRFLGEELRAGNTPAWNPLILAGVPVAPNGNLTTEYPPYWFVRWLDPPDAYNLYVLFHLVVGAMGLYAFSRVLGARPLPSWIAGCLGFAALMWVHLSLHLVHLSGMVWIGLVLAAVHRAIVRPSPAIAAGVAVTFGLWWLGAGTQFSYFGTLAVAGYAAIVLLTHFRTSGLLRPVLAAGAGAALGALIAAPIVLPSAAATGDILRESEPETAMTTSHLPALDLMRIVMPEARGTVIEDGPEYRPQSSPEYAVDIPFVGVAAVVLAGAGVVALDWRRRAPLLVALAAVLLLSFTALPNAIAHGLVPGYNRFRVSARWVAVLPAFVVPLAALGLDALARGDRAARRVTIASAGVAVAVVGVYAGIAMFDSGAPRVFLASRALVAVLAAAGVAVGAVAAARKPQVALAAVLVVVLAEAGFHSGRWYAQVRERGSLADVPVARVAERQGGRIIRLARDYTQLPPFPADVPMAYGLADAQGWTVIFPREMDRYLRLVEDYGDFAKATNVAPPLTNPDNLRSPLLDALDVRTVVSDGSRQVPPEYRLLDAGPPLAYARPSLGPAVVVPRATRASEAGMWRAVARPDWNPAETAAVLGLDRAVDGGPGQVRALDATSDTDGWAVDAPEGGLLRVSARYDDGWSARVDGRRVDVLQADGIFRSVVVPPGRHTVTFAYTNRPEDVGRRLALVALAVCALLLVAEVRLRRRGTTDATPPPPDPDASAGAPPPRPATGSRPPGG